ncbi:MAG: hypothetical protein AAF614_38740 [Chloroflexota bacterium]
METQSKTSKIQWLPTLIIAWNMFDAIIHIAVDMAELLRISGNVIGVAAALIALFRLAKSYNPHILIGAAVVTVILNAIHASDHGFAIPMLVFIGVSLFLLLRWAQVKLAKADTNSRSDMPFYYRWWVALFASLVSVLIVLVSGLAVNANNILDQLHNGRLEGADYWRDEPVILSAGMGFDNIVGLPELTEDSVRDAGGSWYGSLTCTTGDEPGTGSLTSATLANGLRILFKGSTDYDDGLPVVFSWPVATETVDMSDFQFTLNTGEVIFPNAAGMVPSWELSERNTVVLFADFGNRGGSTGIEGVFPYVVKG